MLHKIRINVGWSRFSRNYVNVLSNQLLSNLDDTKVELQNVY